MAVSATTPKKLLVFGDIEGNFRSWCNHIRNANAKSGPIEIAFCVGNFFGDSNNEWEDLKSGAIEVPIRTYILGPCKPEHNKYYSNPDGYEIAPNLTYLGRKGMLSCISGCRVTYLSGVEKKEEEKESHHLFSSKDIKDVLMMFEETGNAPIDILLTSQWPKDVTKFAATPENYDPSHGSALLSLLAYGLKPRYHFAALEGISYERIAYRNHQVLEKTVYPNTQFIALSSILTKGKRKFKYGLNMVSLCNMTKEEILQRNSFTTECPYSVTDDELYSFMSTTKGEQYFYDMKSSDKRKHTNVQKQSAKRQKTSSSGITNKDCWFCLMSPSVERHLIISIGNHSYLALAKGGLISDHLLIISNGHYSCSVELSEETLEEIDRFKHSLKKFFASYGKKAVFYERNYQSLHVAIQVIPVPVNRYKNVKSTFIGKANAMGILFSELPEKASLKQVIPPSSSFFAFEIEDSDGKDLVFYYVITSNFPLQFGREVLASSNILNVPDKVNWKSCTSSVSDEKALSAEIRTAYERYDFTL